jgi:hypothetical protein
MPEKNIDLHGSAPHKHRFALLLIDVINDFDFPEANQLLKHARPMARILLRFLFRDSKTKLEQRSRSRCNRARLKVSIR